MEEQIKPTPLTHPVIIPNSIIKIEVSEYYLRRCQKLLVAMAGQMGHEKFVEAIKKLEEDKPMETLDEAIIDVILPLVDSVEKAAKEQGFVEEKTFSQEEMIKMYESI